MLRPGRPLLRLLVGLLLTIGLLGGSLGSAGAGTPSDPPAEEGAGAIDQSASQGNDACAEGGAVTGEVTVTCTNTGGGDQANTCTVDGAFTDDVTVNCANAGGGDQSNTCTARGASTESVTVTCTNTGGGAEQENECASGGASTSSLTVTCNNTAGDDNSLNQASGQEGTNAAPSTTSAQDNDAGAGDEIAVSGNENLTGDSAIIALIIALLIDLLSGAGL